GGLARSAPAPPAADRLAPACARRACRPDSCRRQNRCHAGRQSQSCRIFRADAVPPPIGMSHNVHAFQYSPFADLSLDTSQLVITQDISLAACAMPVTPIAAWNARGLQCGDVCELLP